MAVTINELKVLALSRIDEQWASTAAALYNGADSANPLQVNSSTWAVVTSAGTTLDTAQLLPMYLTMAANEWCETAYYLEGSATLTWANTRYSYRFNELTNAASQGNLHSVEAATKTVDATVTNLAKMGRDALRLRYPNYRTTNAAPAYFAVDQYAIHLQAKPSSATSMTFYGPCLPEGADTATSWSWMEDSELRRVIPCLAALMIIRRKLTNDSLFGRFEELALEYNDLYTRSRALLSPATREEHFKTISPDLVPSKRGG